MKLLKQRYHLEKVIGQGAMGRVFLARDTQSQQQVAVKEHFIKQGPNEKMYIKRIQREFNFLRKIDHPYVVKAFELFYEHGRYFIVMEYIPGITLEQFLCKEYQSLSVEEQLVIAIKICETTSEINKSGIVHRDVKPANVILHHETYEPYIIDLGIAKQVNDELSALTKAGDIVGTPEYLSPESVVGETYPSSDVFSVGTILYQFFSWQEHSPFFAGSMVSTIDKIVNKDLLPLHEAYPNSDPVYYKISMVLAKSLQKDHLRRISSLAEFASLLRKCQYQEKPVQKNVRWIAVALIIATLVITTAYMVFSPTEKQLIETYKQKAHEYTLQKKYNLAIDYYSRALRVSSEAQVYFQRGCVYQLQAKPNKAINDFGRALQKNREMFKAYFHRAQIYNEQKKYDLATSDLNLATRYNRKFFAAYWLRASIYERQQKYKLAMDEYTTIIEFQPQNAAAYKERGLLHLKQEQYDYAIADLQTCIEKAPKYKKLLSLEIAKAKDKAKTQKSPRVNLEQATNYVTEGLQYEKKHQYDLAVGSYTKAIEVNAENLAAYSNRGLLYIKMRKYDLAVADFSAILKRDDKQVLVYMDRGVAYEGLKNFPLAIKDYTKVIEISPKEIFGYVQRGTLYAQLKKYSKAIYDFTQVLNIIPYHPMAFYHRGMAYYDQQKYQLAIEDFNSAISVKPSYRKAYLARADAYNALGKYYLAINNYNILLRATPNNAKVLRLRGTAYAKNKEHNLAIEDFTRGIVLAPNILLYQSRAYSYVHLHQYDKALQDLQTAIKINANDAYSYYTRGFIHERRGHYRSAVTDYKKAFTLDDTYVDVYFRLAKVYEIHNKYATAMRFWKKCHSLQPDAGWEKNIELCQQTIAGTHQHKMYPSLQKAITAFYDEKSKWAGIYYIASIEKMETEWQQTTVTKVNVRYKYQLIKPHKTYKKIGFDQRFFIVKKMDNRFVVTEMGDANSAYFK
ncbi:protein kinase domain-containing protein [Candidatus Uabimicrobium amorphum]|uniref:Protein kinase domain-containing protein n=1 Tax=Uabimicrobium amorphum TaxID=2596890 RepID=A0A5S9IRD5_UABAM|nr:tetratricopeptide repeat protein [Candidatus Uabimicrobium amorphum]BBM85760.1 hypothetical protein UABAM_04138 [Candidatus Uabimicrobium amorphum]